VRNKLRAEAYREMPRLFVLADALHHGSMQAWALVPPTPSRGRSTRKASCSGFAARVPDSDGLTRPIAGKVLNRGVEAAHTVMVKIFEKLPAGVPLKFTDIVEAENKIPRRSSILRCGNG